MKLSPEDRLGPVWALVLGCALPIGYGIYDYVVRKVFNLLSVLGLVAVLLKGVFGILKTSAFWIACSEAALPLLFGIAILFTIRGQEPLVQRFLLSPQLFDIDRIRRQLGLRGTPKTSSTHGDHVRGLRRNHVPQRYPQLRPRHRPAPR